MVSLQSWMAFLKDSHGGAGLPLVLAGLALMLFGWRMRRICVVLSYGFLGATLGATFTAPGQNQWLYPLLGGVVLAAASYIPVHSSISLLGGLVGAAAAFFMVSGPRVNEPVLWTLTGVTLVVCTAFAVLNRVHVVIGVTAFFGAACLVSGLSCWTMAWPGVHVTFQSMMGETKLVVPFLIIVPTVMSFFYQVSEMRKLNLSL